ncbi:hypothetical protein [Endozoicomonas sp. 4G]|uniref:hypothetical protein n=1 Tax=Endozoicomonas sp. 4G TaxID=2872754 RepID=UPI0020791964|nr:hypothetical protein [Endozoicomonas sp. 4G]
MIFSALAIGIHFIVLWITLISGSALALDETQKNMLKQLTLQEYEKLDSELKEKDLYKETESYINRAMSAINIRERTIFFKTQNREIAKQMGIKSTDNTAKFAIPSNLLRTFNLVQAMIRYDDGKIKNSAASAVTDYVERLLSEQRAEQEPAKNTAFIEILYESRLHKRVITSPIAILKNTQWIFLDQTLDDSIDHRKMHLLRNGKIVFTNVNIIRKVHLKDGDKIVSTDNSSNDLELSPIKNPASKAREIYIAVNRLQAFLDKKYPEKFRFIINNKNMFKLSLYFIAPNGWWKDAYFSLVFDFGSSDKKEPYFYLSHAPDTVSFNTDEDTLKDHYQGYKKFIFDLHNVWPDNFFVEQQILNIINFISYEINIIKNNFFSRSFNGNSPQDNLIKEIIDSNILAQRVPPPIPIETDRKTIENNVHKIIKDEEGLFFDYLVTNELQSESISTAIFQPVRMYNEAEIVEFDYTSIKNFYDLIYEARRKSGFIIPKYKAPIVYYKNKNIDRHKVLEALHDIKKGNKKSKKKHNIMAMIVRVPGYERSAFELAKRSSTESYIPENSPKFTYNKRTNTIVLSRENEVPKLIKWEIHLFENKKLAKANNMLNRYKILLPSNTLKTTERYRGGPKRENNGNVWIPTVIDDMSEVQKRFALMSMYDLSRKRFRIPNNLKKDSVLNLGNDIITKALLTPQDDKWLLSQPHLELLLQRVKMSLLINHKDYSTTKQYNTFFESVINGTVDEHVIEDLELFLPHLTPGLSHLPRMDSKNKTAIIYRIILNYLIEFCIRTLIYNELDTSSEITQQLIEKPEEFSLKDIYAYDQQGFSVAFDVLKIIDFLFTKTLFNPLHNNPLHKKPFDLAFDNNEIKGFLLDIDNMHEAVDHEENPIPLFLNLLLPAAKYYFSDLDFETKEFLNSFTLRILQNYGSRTKNKDVKASLLAFLKNTEQKSDFFSKEKADKLISAFRENIPEFLVNVPNGKGGFRQTCYHCDGVYETEKAIGGTGGSETRVKPFHKGCMKEDKYIREQAGQLFKEMEKGYPKKQFFKPDNAFNPVPDGFELIRINGDGNCMYSSIAEIFNQNSALEGIWSQQRVRQIMHYTLNQIYSRIQHHPDKKKLMQELELLSGIRADLIQAVLDHYIIINSASTGQSELGRLQQFGDAQLMTLLVPTQGVWFPVITQGDYGSYHEIYDLRRWVKLAPNLLAMLLRNEDYRFPDLTENQRKTLLQLLLEQNFAQAEVFVSQILAAPHDSSAYLIHYPSSVALLEHFDAAVSLEAPQNMEVYPPQTVQLDAAFHDPSNDESNKRINLDPDSSISNNETDRETLQDNNPLWLMMQAVELLTTPDTPTHSL